MKSTQIPAQIKELIFESLSLTHDGIGVFSAGDILVYCNNVMAAMFGLQVKSATGKSFDELIEFCYTAKTGLAIETDKLEDWLEMAHRLRRSKKFRSFEVDHVDNRWFLVTEHTAMDDTLLLFCSEITLQKKNEAKLRDLNEKLTELAYRDSLTGIFNRRYFYESARIELSRCIRQKSGASMLMMDLDYFKTVNDQFGHEGGDQVLIEITALVRDLLRNYDIFGRLGGEEFGIFLPDTDLAEANVIGMRILDKLRQHVFLPPLETHSVTASMGVAGIDETRTTLDVLIRAADEKLYLAKREGRDNVQSCA